MGLTQTKAAAQYLAWGVISNASLKLYYAAPRQTLQSEFLNLHRYALKKAHTARVKAEITPGKAVIE